MKKAPELTAERLHEVLRYDPKTGVFTWLDSTRKVRTTAGTLTARGHLVIAIDRVFYGAARLAWLFTSGEHPRAPIKYLNGDTQDLRWCNLGLMETGKQALTLESLREVTDYEPETGHFYRKKAGARVGAPITTLNSCGYVAVGVFGKNYSGHRLAWFWHHGTWPEGVLDHINRNRADNRIGNLRAANHTVNNQNRTLSTRNKSGTKGVGLVRPTGRWRATIGVKNSLKYIGTFDDINDAIAARKAAEAKYHPFAVKEVAHA